MAAAAVIERDIFVDDLYTFCESEMEAVISALRKDVTSLWLKGVFHY